MEVSFAIGRRDRPSWVRAGSYVQYAEPHDFEASAAESVREYRVSAETPDACLARWSKASIASPQSIFPLTPRVGVGIKN